MTDATLKVESLRREFDGLVAVDDVDFEMAANEIHGVIGPNGAGKTTFFNLISGALEATTGRIYFDGREVTDLPAHRRADLGIIQVFQITSVFPELTVAENVFGARNAREGLLNPFRSSNPGANDAVTEVLQRIGLAEQADETAKTLAYGEQKVLEIGMALATDPSVLLFDEPTAGLSSKETAEIKTLVRDLADEITILLVEHDMDIIMDLVDRITVFHRGSILAQGSPGAIARNERVQDVYLGRD